MYNGIGLATARGSGSNGYVQRNLSSFSQSGAKMKYNQNKMDENSIRKPNLEILEHNRKRDIELKCVEMEDVLVDEGYSRSEIDSHINQYRLLLSKRENNSKKSAVNVNLQETHSAALAQHQKNDQLKKAFGISEFFVEGSSFDSDRKNKEDEARKEFLQKKDDERSRWDYDPESPKRKCKKTRFS